MPGIADGLRRDRQVVALPVSLIVQLSGRQTPRALTQPPARCLIARRSGYRQRQRVHPQQRAAVVQPRRRQLKPLSFQPPGVEQPVRRQRHRPVAQYPAACAAGIVLQQGQRHAVRRQQRTGVCQRIRVQGQGVPLPQPLRVHRAGLHLPVAVAEQLAVRAHTQCAGQPQLTAPFRQQRTAIVQPLAGQLQGAALQPSAVDHVTGAQRQVPAGQHSLILHPPGADPAVAPGSQCAGVAQAACRQPRSLYILRQLPCRPQRRVVRCRQRNT